MNKRSFFIGLLVGIIIGSVTICYAFIAQTRLVDQNENSVGTASNPLYVTSL